MTTKSQRINDPALDQIREVRHQISAEFGHDPARVLAYYTEFEEQLLRKRVPMTGENDEPEQEAPLNDTPPPIK